MQQPLKRFLRVLGILAACSVFLSLDEGLRGEDVYGWDEHHGYLGPWCKAPKAQ